MHAFASINFLGLMNTHSVCDIDTFQVEDVGYQTLYTLTQSMWNLIPIYTLLSKHNWELH